MRPKNPELKGNRKADNALGSRALTQSCTACGGGTFAGEDVVLKVRSLVTERQSGWLRNQGAKTMSFYENQTCHIERLFFCVAKVEYSTCNKIKMAIKTHHLLCKKGTWHVHPKRTRQQTERAPKWGAGGTALHPAVAAATRHQKPR